MAEMEAQAALILRLRLAAVLAVNRELSGQTLMERLQVPAAEAAEAAYARSRAKLAKDSEELAVSTAAAAVQAVA